LAFLATIRVASLSSGLTKFSKSSSVVNPRAPTLPALLQTHFLLAFS